MNYLEHYGVLGMKWGIRRTPEQLGHKLAKKTISKNLEKWGTDSDHNVLYISGYSGSGKSTLATAMADEDTDIIHLDLYFEGEPGQESIGSEHRSKEFDTFLSIKNIYSPNLIPKDKWKEKRVLQRFEEAIESFGRKQYNNKRKVIVEGVEILDDSIRPDKSYFNTKPIILLGTNPIVSMQRAFTRDGRGNLLKGLVNLDSASAYLQWYSGMRRTMRDIEDSAQMQKGSKLIEEILSKNQHLSDKEK